MTWSSIEAPLILQPARGFASVPPTSKLDGGLSADDCAQRVGSQAAVPPHVLLFNGVADDQVASREAVVAALRAEVDFHVVLPPPATKKQPRSDKQARNARGRVLQLKGHRISLLLLLSYDWF